MSKKNNGGKTSYYLIPKKSKQIQDLIENRSMNWNIANIFKSCYRFGEQEHSTKERDLNKIIWFAKRELKLLKKKELKK